MKLAHESLKGLDRDRLLAVVEPILIAHGVDAVELLWRSDPRGWVLFLTVERPGSTESGAGVTLDLCAEISRDLSAALDVADVVPSRYRLEVGSPGVDRVLYGASDYVRFSGRKAKLKLREPVLGQRVISGHLKGLDDDGLVLIESDGREHRIPPAEIESGRLSFDWQAALQKPGASRGRKRHDRRPAERYR
jgi:ribosome maturation factor RimP